MRICKNCKNYEQAETSVTLNFITMTEEEKKRGEDKKGSWFPPANRKYIEIYSPFGVMMCVHESCFTYTTSTNPQTGLYKGSTRIVGQAQLNPEGRCKYYKRKWWKFWIKDDITEQVGGGIHGLGKPQSKIRIVK